MLIVRKLKRQSRKNNLDLTREEYLNLEKEQLDEIIEMLDVQCEKLEFEQKHFSFKILGLLPITFDLLVGLVITVSTTLAIMFGEYIWDHIFNH